jgi:hypothetical protein
MATLSVQTIVDTGLKPIYASADVAGDEFDNSSGRVFLHVVNGAVACNATATTQNPTVSVRGYGTLTVGDLVVNVPATENRMIGPFPTTRFNDGDNLVQVSYDDISNVTVAAISLP